MGIFRLYSGDDGESHMEELDLASHPELTTLQGAKGVVFRSSPPGVSDCVETYQNGQDENGAFFWHQICCGPRL